ncbi:sugar ABC transporter ATP-binding protein [soil metagenome]
MTSTLRLNIVNISKSFPGVKALDQVSLDLYEGEVHAICGENGAGKSTLMNILSGHYQQDEGELILNGQRVIFGNPLEARKSGIAIVHQDHSLVNNLNVAENIFAGCQPVNKWGLIDYKRLNKLTKDLLNRLQITGIKPGTLVEYLSPAKKQMVEIAKALSQKPDILILDEPTASIAETEVNIIFDLIAALKKESVSILYISHRMQEILKIADRVSVLKDGKYQGTERIEDTSIGQIIKKMVGRDLLEQNFRPASKGEIVFKVEGLSGSGFEDINFSLCKGEILGLSGLVGAGRTEMVRAIFGADPIWRGNIYLKGGKINTKHPQEAIKHKIGYVPEDRKDKGLFLNMSVAHNIASTGLHHLAKNGFISKAKLYQRAEIFKNKLRIKTYDLNQQALFLSGGNQQKIVLAKWLSIQPEIFIVDEPTHGVDVGAKAEIYQILTDLAANGTAILLISSELPEILALSSRILVMYNGRLTGELSADEATEEKIMHLASGEKSTFAA